MVCAGAVVVTVAVVDEVDVMVVLWVVVCVVVTVDVCGVAPDCDPNPTATRTPGLVGVRRPAAVTPRTVKISWLPAES